MQKAPIYTRVYVIGGFYNLPHSGLQLQNDFPSSFLYSNGIHHYSKYEQPSPMNTQCSVDTPEYSRYSSEFKKKKPPRCRILNTPMLSNVLRLSVGPWNFSQTLTIILQIILFRLSLTVNTIERKYLFCQYIFL